MNEQPASILSPLGKQAAQFTWLLCDALLLLVLLALLMFYKDLGDEAMHRLIRGYVLFCVGFFILSALHLLAYHRHDDAQAILKSGAGDHFKYTQFPWYKSYGIFSLKMLWAAVFLVPPLLAELF